MTGDLVTLACRIWHDDGLELFRIERVEDEWKDGKHVRWIEDGFMVHSEVLTTFVNFEKKKYEYSSFEAALDAASQFMRDFKE
jgi:hypothetical protein